MQEKNKRETRGKQPTGKKNKEVLGGVYFCHHGALGARTARVPDTMKTHVFTTMYKMKTHVKSQQTHALNRANRLHFVHCCKKVRLYSDHSHL